MMKKVSVLVPAYNHGEYIGDAINSILESDYKNLEIIVVDDGSKDDTRDVVANFKDVIYIHQENAGAAHAINKAISVASGDYLSILNDDDVFLPQHISVAVNNLEKYGNRIFVGKPDIVGSGDKALALEEHILQSRLHIKSLGLGRSLFQINWAISTSAYVFDQHLASELNGFQNFAMCHDLDFLIRALLEVGAGVGTSSEVTWLYRCHETNSGSSISLKKQHAEIVYCLGRAVNPVLENDVEYNLAQLIGHGIDPEIIALAAQDRPWLLESNMPVCDSIARWVLTCL